jgi:tetratricopeptide (TPR) repeat protein
MGGQDASIHNAISGSMTGQIVQAGSVGEVHFHRRPRNTERPAPRQLPVALRSFASREWELERLRRWRAGIEDSAPLLVLTGPAGVGKSTLAVRWLHEMRDEYSDGQLFVDLGGARRSPADPTDILEWFLVSLGMPAGKIPVERAQREAMYRSLSSERKIVVLLDDALSAAQVRSLVPAGGQSLAVVTSRSRLSGLAMTGAHWVEVDPLDRSGSLKLLYRILGPDRVSSESDAAGELIELCGGLPLALSVVAGRLATRPRRRLAREVADLRVQRRRLATLSLADDISVEAVLDVSYEGLSEDAALLYRLCAEHPGREFGLDVASAAIEWSPDRVESIVDGLIEANFLIETGDGRYSYHDLIRVHAQQRASAADSSDRRAARLRRMVDWYLRRTVTANTTIHPHRSPLAPLEGDLGVAFADEREALAWLETERGNLRAVLDAAVRYEWHDLGWRFCEALWGFFLHTRHYGDWIAMQLVGIDCAHRCGNLLAEARLRSQLGFAYAKLRRYADAVMQNEIALRLAESAGDEQAKATALSQLGRAARGNDDLASALDYYRQARDLQHQLGQRRGVALSRRRIGDVLGRLGRYAEAVTELRAAAETMRELGDRTQYARTLMFIGRTQLRAGHLDLADDALAEALSLMREFGSTYYQAEILAGLGELAEQRGDRQAARDHYSAAGALYAEVEDPKSEAIRARLVDLGIPPPR